MDNLFANVAVSVTELKRNYAGILKKAEDGPVALTTTVPRRIWCPHPISSA